MIAKTSSFEISDGRTFKDLEAAQAAELRLVLGLNDEDTVLVSTLLEKRAQVIDVLSLTPTSRPGARKPRKARKPKEPTNAQPAKA